MHQLTMVPPSSYYLANCLTLRNVEVSGPIVVSGRKRFVSGEPYVRARNIIIVGDTGAHIDSNRGQYHHSVAKDLVSHSGHANVHDLSEVGAQPRRWLELLTVCYNKHMRYALPKPGKPGDPSYLLK